MKLIEIIVIIVSALIVCTVIIMSIINKKNGRTSCGCDCKSCSRCFDCKNKDKTNKT